MHDEDKPFWLPLRNRRREVIGHTLIDSADRAWAEQWRWRFHKDSYVARWDNDRKQSVMLHRGLMGLPPTLGADGLVVDHINGDGFDNRRRNLRVCAHAENLQNQTARDRGGVSAFRGVSLDPAENRTKRWKAQVKLNGRVVYSTRHATEAEAAVAVAAARAHLMPFSEEFRATRWAK